LLESDFNILINFSNLISPYKSTRKVFVYGTIGLGYAGWYTKLLNKVYDANTIETDNPLNNFHSSLSIPVGLGVFYRISDRFNASLEYTFHLMSSKLLDQLAANNRNDRYDILSFGISINLGKPRKKTIIKVNDYPYSLYTPESTSQPITPPVMEPRPESPVITPQGFTYSVQIFAFISHKYSPEYIRKRYHIPQPVRVENDGRVERFLVGKSLDLQKAKEIQAQLIRLGIRDAFIVAYKNGVRHHTMTP